MKGMVKLVGISNFVRFEDGAQETRLIIELPGGKAINAFVSEEDLATVVEAFAPGQAAAAPPESKMEAFVQSLPPPNPTLFVKEELPNGEEALIFGGVPTAEPPPEMVLPKPKSRLVGKDSAGNPIVEVEGAEDVSMLTTQTGEKDEDGVAQL